MLVPIPIDCTALWVLSGKPQTKQNQRTREFPVVNNMIQFGGAGSTH